MDEAAFIRAVIENPDADGPRQVYADWLEERGDPRGEFIRVQCELARQPNAGDPRRPALLERERELIRRHRDEWEAPLRTLGARDSRPWPHRAAVEFQRGLAYAVTMSSDAFLRCRDALMRAAPITRLTLTGVGAGHAGRLAACGELGRVTDLTLSGPPGLGDEGLSALIASPHLGNLITLELPDNDIHDRGVRALAASPSIPRLEVLFLDHNEIGAAGYRALAESFTMKRLRSLSLPGASTRVLPGYSRQEEEQALLDLLASLPLLTAAGLGQWHWSDTGGERCNEVIRRRWASRQRG